MARSARHILPRRHLPGERADRDQASDKREDLAAYNEEYAKYIPTDKPARTTVEVMLNSSELLVEIAVTAGIPDERQRMAKSS
jgi:hypothetical protein